MYTLFNYKTNKEETIETIPADCSCYIPQNAHAQALYRLYMAEGKTSIEAAVLILGTLLGKYKPQG